MGSLLGEEYAFRIKDHEVFEPVGRKQGKMEIQLDTSSLSHFYSSEALPHRIFFSQSLGTVGCVKDKYGFFFPLDIHFLYTSLLLRNVMLQNFVGFNLVSWLWVTQRYTYLLPLYPL